MQGAVERLRQSSDLPVAVGFGIRTAEQAAAIARVADAAVVGSAFVDLIRANLDGNGRAQQSLIGAVTSHVDVLASGVRSAR